MNGWARQRALWAAWVVALFAAACGGGDADAPSAPPGWLKADVSTFNRHGVYWNPAEPGTGFFFEAQGATGIATFYLYEADGRPVWYTSAGSFVSNGLTGFKFSGALQRYAGGQPASSPTPKTPTSTVLGSVTITFDGDKAQVALPGRSFQAEKFYKAGSTTGPTSAQPETGIYWNAAESGRGYTIEVANGVATVAVFHYADDGQPIWHLVTASLSGDTAINASGDFAAYAGGQTLAGAYKAPASPVAQGRFALDFSVPCTGKIGFPAMPQVSVQRFAFGTLAAGKECRTPPRIPYTVSPIIQASSIFSDVVLKLETLPFAGYSKSVGGTMPGGFSFSASGNIASLNGRTVYVIVVDPHGFYTSTTPQVQLRASPPGASVLLTPKPISQIGDYKADLLFYACLDPNCATQFTGSPFRLPYSVFVR